MIRVVEAKPWHAEMLAPRMRFEDAQECWALGQTPRQATYDSISNSHFAYSAFDGDDLIACYGVVPYGSILDVAACPWLLTTPLATRHAKLFFAENKAFLRFVKALYPVLETQVDARYDTAIKWLKRLGFSIFDPAPFGPYAMNFHRARLEA